MNHPTGGRPQQPHPGQQQPGQQQYPGQPGHQPPYPGQQQFPGQPPPGQPPYPGQQPPFPGQQYPGRPPFPGAQPPYPGQPYPGRPGPPRPPGKGAAIVAGLLYLPGVLLALTGSVSLSTRGAFGRDLWGAILMPPLPDVVVGFELAVAISFVLPGSALVLTVLLLARVPGVRWGLVVISLLAAVHYALLLADVMSVLPPSFGVLPVIALLLWLVAGLVAMLPPVGRAMRGAKPKTPPHRMPGPPPPVPGPPPPGQWG